MNERDGGEGVERGRRAVFFKFWPKSGRKSSDRRLWKFRFEKADASSWENGNFGQSYCSLVPKAR